MELLKWGAHLDFLLLVLRTLKEQFDKFETLFAKGGVVDGCVCVC